jgi:phosphoribosylamine---glycine ligase
MNVIIIGGGGREHAIAREVAKSTMLNHLYVLPGNPGTATIAQNVPLSDFYDIKKFAIENEVSLIIVGPEVPLVAGFADVFSDRPDILVIGPSAEGAQLEGSKAFSKKFMKRHGIPTARYFECTSHNLADGVHFLQSLTPPFVLKADGLAAGKGVLILSNLQEAIGELETMLDGKFGDASTTVVIEEFLSGIEFSVFALTDGEHYAMLPEAKDYKRIGEGDTGLNTGGMGAVSPVPFYDESLQQKVIATIIKPTIAGLASEKIDYKGFIFFGLISVNDNPFVIEYNCRMGDPETEVVFPRITSDVLAIFNSVRDGSLCQDLITVSPTTATTVVMVSGGYPEEFEKGKFISIGSVHADTYVYHSGTKIENDTLCTNGGRVLAITSLGNDIADALDKSYASITQIDYDKKYFRKDIGQDLMSL